MEDSTMQVVPITNESRFDDKLTSPDPKPKKRQKSKRSRVPMGSKSFKQQMDDSQREMFYKGFDRD
jgi:hypothetical protein